MNTNRTESSEVSSDQDPIQSSQLLKLQEMCVDNSIGPKLTCEPLFSVLKTLWHNKPDPAFHKAIKERIKLPENAKYLKHQKCNSEVWYVLNKHSRAFEKLVQGRQKLMSYSAYSQAKLMDMLYSANSSTVTQDQLEMMRILASDAYIHLSSLNKIETEARKEYILYALGPSFERFSSLRDRTGEELYSEEDLKQMTKELKVLREAQAKSATTTPKNFQPPRSSPHSRGGSSSQTRGNHHYQFIPSHFQSPQSQRGQPNIRRGFITRGRRSRGPRRGRN